MSALREEIRAILREELAALRAEGALAEAPAVERVRIADAADLTRFARDLLARAAGDPGLAGRVAAGAVIFEPVAGPGPAVPAPPPAASAPPPAPPAPPPAPSAPAGAAIVTGPPRSAPPRLDKPLVTERDIAALAASTRRVVLGPASRLTPLARDELRRRGIRIERTER